MAKNIIYFILVITITLNSPPAYSADSALFKARMQPMFYTLSIFKDYKNKPHELFKDKTLAEYKFAKEAAEFIAKNKIKTLPDLKREGYFLTFESGSQKIKIYFRDAHLGLFLINDKPFVLGKYAKFNELIAELSRIVEGRPNASLLDLLLPRAEAIGPVLVFVVINILILGAGAYALIQEGNEKDVSNPECVKALWEIEGNNLLKSPNEELLRRLLKEYNTLLKSTKYSSPILEHTVAIQKYDKRVEKICADIPKETCEEYKNDYFFELGKRSAIYDAHKERTYNSESDRREIETARSPVRVAGGSLSMNLTSQHIYTGSSGSFGGYTPRPNVSTTKDCLKLYDKFIWDVLKVQNQGGDINLYINTKDGTLSLENKDQRKYIRVAPT